MTLKKLATIIGLIVLSLTLRMTSRSSASFTEKLFNAYNGAKQAEANADYHFKQAEHRAVIAVQRRGAYNMLKEVGDVQPTPTPTTAGYDIGKLSWAVGMAETWGGKRWYGASHNNLHGIKHGNTAPCPWVPKLKMCRYSDPQQSHEAFKKIWSRWYKRYPDYALAKKWTGSDRVHTWLKNVNYWYNHPENPGA